MSINYKKAESVNQFIENGFLIKRNMFSENEISVYLNEFDRIVKQLKKSGENIKIAPIITSISDGSQALNIFKKPKTFSGLTIPEIVRPKPKTIPDIREDNFVIIFQKLKL